MRDRVLNFFWPTHPRIALGLVGRAGRVVHWIGLGYATLFIGMGLMVLSSGGPGLLDVTNLWPVPAALGVASVGRMFRYLLAGE